MVKMKIKTTKYVREKYKIIKILQWSNIGEVAKVSKFSRHHKFNIILLGNVAVGKTTLLLRFTEGKFVDDLPDVEQKQKTLNIGNTSCNLVLTDTAGQERFRTLTSSFFRSADAMIFVYDIANKESFTDLPGHFSDGERYTKRALKFVVGNKNDLANRVVEHAEGKDLADNLGVEFFETSAKSGSGVDELFELVCTKLLEIKKNEGDGHGKPGKSEKKSKDQNCIIS